MLQYVLFCKSTMSETAPSFEGMAVVGGQLKKISPTNFAGKYVVLFFYPTDFVSDCLTEVIAFSDRLGEFREINCELVGCSTDSHFTHLAWYASEIGRAHV